MFMLQYKLSKNIRWKIKNGLANTCKFSNQDFNEFVLLLLKGVYLYEYPDDYKRKNNFTVT